MQLLNQKLNSTKQNNYCFKYYNQVQWFKYLCKIVSFKYNSIYIYLNWIAEPKIISYIGLYFFIM